MLTEVMFRGIIILLLAVAEDRATVRTDLNAVYGVGEKSDTMHMGCRSSFLL